MTIRKWDKEIRAWLDGAELEFKCQESSSWELAEIYNPISKPDLYWRVKISDEDAAFNEWANSSLPAHLCYRDMFKAGWEARTKDYNAQ